MSLDILWKIVTCIVAGQLPAKQSMEAGNVIDGYNPAAYEKSMGSSVAT